MLKKMFATLAIVTMFTVQVNAATNEVRAFASNGSIKEDLTTAYDELNYSLTVEWDQKDPVFRAQKMNEFFKSVRNLQSKGLTNAELVDFAKSQLKDAKAAKDLGAALNVIEINKMSTEEANRYVVETMKKSYSVGASWQSINGDLLYTFLLIGLVALLIAAAASTPSYPSTTYPTTCGYENVYVCGYDYYYDYYCYYEYQYLCF